VTCPPSTRTKFHPDPYGWLDSTDDSDRPLGSGWEAHVPIPRDAKVLCAGLNYCAHADEANREPPPHPDVFGRWASSLVGT